MNDPSITPAVAPDAVRRKWLLRRIYPSTWVAMLLAIGIMVLVEIPGRRTSLSTYAHGWPLVWMERDYAQNTSLFYPPLTDEDRESWIKDGLLVETEYTLNPWSKEYATDANPPHAAVDLAFSLLIVVLAAWAFQQWRRWRGPLVRFRLRTLFIVTTIVAVISAQVAAWYHAHQRDERAVLALGADVHLRQIVYRWLPPAWLPESLVKLPGARETFCHVHTVVLIGDHDVDKAIESLAGLPDLASLSISDAQSISDAGWLNLARLTNLRSLLISKAPVTDERVEQLASLSKLEELSLDNSTLSGAGLAQLVQFKNLTNLDVTSPRITAKGLAHLQELAHLKTLTLHGSGLGDNLIDALEKLPNLEELTLSETSLEHLRLAGFARLKSITVNKDLKLTSVVLQDLPNLKAIDIRAPAEVHFSGIGGVENLTLDDCILAGDADVAAIEALNNVTEISLSGLDVHGSGRLSLTGCARLTNLTLGSSGFVELRVADAPKLEQFDCSGNSRLEAVRLERLPSLETINLGENTRLVSVDLRETENVGDLSIDSTGYGAPADGPWSPLALRGLAALKQLRSLTIHHSLGIGSDLLRQIAGRDSIESLDLDDSRLSDDDLAVLVRLSNLSDLDLTGNEIRGPGLVHLQSLTKLSRLRLKSTPVSDEAVSSLQRAMPTLKTVDFESKKPALDSLHAQSDRVRQRKPRTISVDHGDQIGDSDLGCLDTLDGLENLDLSGTHLTDDGLKHLENLSHLKTLQLHNTHITGSGFRHLRDSRNLESLDLGGTVIDDAGFKQIAALPQLKKLDLNSARVTGENLAALAAANSLEELNLYDTRITDADLPQLRKLAALKRLSLEGTKVTAEGLANAQPLRALEELDLTATDVDVGALKRLDEMPKLKELDLTWCTVSGKGLATLAALPALERLHLRGAGLGEADLKQLRGLSHLTRIYLHYHTGFSPGFDASTVHDLAKNLADVASLPTPVELDLIGDSITDAEMAEVGRVKNLDSLNMASCSVTDAGLKYLGALPRLKKLSLGYEKKLTSAAIEGLRGLNALEDLEVTGQTVSDESLPALAKLPRLRKLTLSNSQITDAAVPVLKQFPALQRLSINESKMTEAGRAALGKLLVTTDDEAK